MIPQLIVVVLLASGLTLALVKHGEPKGDWSFWTQLIAVVLDVALLYWGGWWNDFL